MTTLSTWLDICHHEYGEGSTPSPYDFGTRTGDSQRSHSSSTGNRNRRQRGEQGRNPECRSPHCYQALVPAFGSMLCPFWTCDGPIDHLPSG